MMMAVRMTDQVVSGCAAPYRIRGLSLIELMIVVAIVGIIAAVAYPSYTRYVQETRETEAQGLLLEWAGALEIYRAKNFSYAGATLANTMPALVADEFYTFALVLGANNQSFTLTATPIAGSVVDGRPVLTWTSAGVSSW